MAEISEAEADSYRILGVQPGATVKEIRVAFRRQAMLHHPDRNPGNSAAEERFKEVLKAYQIALRAIERRRQTAAAAAEARQRRAGYEPAGGYVRRSRGLSVQTISRLLLLVLFTVVPMFLILLVIWANTPTDWIPNCCPQLRIEKDAGPLGRLGGSEPERQLEFEPLPEPESTPLLDFKPPSEPEPLWKFEPEPLPEFEPGLDGD